MHDEIETSLFDWLDEVATLLEKNKKVEVEEELILNMHKIEANLENFVENFYLQFFNYGFGLDIEGINEEALYQIEERFPKSSKDAPKNMVESFREALETIQEIQAAVYLDPPREEDLYDAYIDFLPKLFESFGKDGTVVTDRIKNAGAIRIRMESVLKRIGLLKQQKQLS